MSNRDLARCAKAGQWLTGRHQTPNRGATLLQQGDAAALPIYVFTNSATAFVNTSGLTTLRSPPAILVKGLLFLEPQSVTINGVTVPAGKLVMLAKTVTQLP